MFMAKPKIKVQATEISFELHTLGWKAFQDLCITVATEVFGQTVESFLASHDGGRDGAFRGVWKSGKSEAMHGAFVVQCKFFSSPDKRLSLSDIADELDKAKQLANKGLADNYLLMTNAGVSGSAHEKIAQAFLSVAGIRECRVFGKDRLCLFIRESARLRMLVPRVYGLGDLSQILDQRSYDQAQEILSSLGDDLAKFVITEAYRKSARAVLEHGFVLLLGEAAAGKSTIAAALAMGAFDLWDCQPIKVSNAQEFTEHWNPNERQFFWVDDAFGSTQYERDQALAWNHALGQLNAAIKKHTKILFTSRDYIYRWAVSEIKLEAFPLLRESQVVIQVSNLTEAERAQMLYNHLKLGTQSQAFKGKIKPFLATVAKHRDFKPEIARRLGSPIFTKQLQIDADSVTRFVTEPLPFLLDVIRTLDAASKAALSLIFMRGGQISSPLELSQGEIKALRLLGANLSDVRKALSALDLSLVLKFQEQGRLWWKFKHPTIREAVSVHVADDPELMGIYLVGAPVEKIFGEIACGETDLQNVKVFVPQEFYDVVIDRLKEWKMEKSSEFWHRDRLPSFLAYRCDVKFLKRYLERNPNVFDQLLRFGAYLSVHSAPRLYVRLYSAGLLPEAERKRFVQRVHKILETTLDDGFLKISGMQQIFTEEELQECFELAKSLLDHIEGDIEWEEESFDPASDNPDDHFDNLKTRLRAFQRAMSDDDQAYDAIENGLDEIRAAERRLADRVEEVEEMKEAADNPFSKQAEVIENEAERSIFEDVDS